MNKYPWISFIVNLEFLSHQTWIHLGECLSNCEHISRIPLKPSISAQMHKVYLAKGVLATAAIEGNTLAEEEVRLRIEKKLDLPPSREYLGQEIDNILELCNEIINNAVNGKQPLITIEEICRYNKVILNKVPLREHVIPGKFRNYPVEAAGYKTVNHNDIPELMQRLCNWLNSADFQIKGLPAIINSIIKATVAHLYAAWIHPFGDGNGRTTRILEFAILSSSGIPYSAAQLLSNHYNATRNEYYIQLDTASKKNDISGFLFYVIQGFRDGLVEQLNYIFYQVLDISWENFVYDTFREYRHTGDTAKRRRILAIELFRQPGPIAMDKLVTLSKETIDLYQNRSHMTLSRDLKDLIELGLVEKTDDKGYRAKKEKMLIFLPAQGTLIDKK